MLERTHRTLGSRIFDELLQRITSGFYKEGQKMPTENELCAEFSVSRPVVRSALQELKNQGLVTTTKGVGSFVRRNKLDNPLLEFMPVDEQEDLVRCFEFRIALEGPMAAWAARNCDTHDKILLQKAFDAAEKAFLLEEQTALDTDLEFHLAIAEATHNRFFPQAMKSIRIQIADGMSKIAHYFVGNKARHSSIKSVEHSLILEAILRGDSVMAEAAMVLHLKRSMNWVL